MKLRCQAAKPTTGASENEVVAVQVSGLLLTVPSAVPPVVVVAGRGAYEQTA